MVAWPRLEALPAAAGDPLLGSLPPGAAGLHWNEDGLEPPPGAVELLRRVDGPGSRARAFRAGRFAWGVQFHPEVDDEILAGWYRDWPAACAQAGVSVPRARAADARHMRDQRALAEAIFGGFARVVATRAAHVAA
jgi:GMP synthase (glutamine-hydrolysing)